MQAVRFHAHGGTDQLRYESAPDPVPAPGEVIVRVRACALNFLDIWQRRGIPGIKIPLPHIPGSDVAGVVESVGTGVSHLRQGDETIVCPGISCMHCESCLAGRDNQCPGYSILGYSSDGGYAELVKIPAVNAFPHPKGLEATAAAAVPLVYMTAWHMLVGRCLVKAGDDVLVIGAGSGVGSAAIQVAKFFRARVIATAGTDAKLEQASLLGADCVINHSRQSIRSEVRRFTGARGVDIAFEHVGTATWQDSLGSLAPGGRLVTCGATTGFDVGIDLRHLFAKQISLLGSYMGTKSELLEVLHLVSNGHLRPVVSDVLPLKDAAQAQTLLENRQHFGKVVLSI